MKSVQHSSAITLFRFFLFLVFFQPILYLLFLSMLGGVARLGPVMMYVGIVFIPVILITLIVFRRFHKKISGLLKGSNDKQLSDLNSTDIEYINSYPFRGTLLLLAGSMLIPVIIAVGGYALDSIPTVIKALYICILGEFLAIAFASLFFYKAKKELYYLSDSIEYKPLKILYGFVIPIFSSLLLLLSFISVGLYRFADGSVIDAFFENTKMILLKNKGEINIVFQEAVIETSAYSLADSVISMDGQAVREFLNNVDRKRSRKQTSYYPMAGGGQESEIFAGLKNVEFFFIADRSGRAVRSDGKTMDIKDEGFFKNVLFTGQSRLDKHYSGAFKEKEYMVSAVPVLRGGEIVGVLGAYINLGFIKRVLAQEETENTMFMIVSKSGKVLYFNNDEIVNKVIGKDIVDFGKRTKNIQSIATSPEYHHFNFVLDDQGYHAMKITIDNMKASLLVMVKTEHLFRQADLTLLLIILLIMSVSCVLFLTIKKISERISSPIQNTVGLFKLLARGDLTVESRDYVRDEFGELIRNFKIFLIKIREIIRHALNMAEQLSTSAEELSATSSMLADSAQKQAASVEQSSASLEEISASLHAIAGHSQNQSQFADQSYTAMEKLKEKVQEVSQNTEVALQMAQNTSLEAKKGNEQMANTIARMDNIDTSTAKIAEIVGLIRDISDQVNLLSLNAAIEAARAGEHGRGFAVVADEISKLAEQTTQSANTITQLVESGRNEVMLGRSQVDATSNSLQNILQNINKTEEIVNLITTSVHEQNIASDAVVEDTKKVKEMAGHISQSTSEQSTINKEMVQTIEVINQQTQAVASASEQIAASAKEITGQSESLHQLIEFFKV